MIYGIQIGSLVIREISRQIDREQNQAFIAFLVDVLYGVTLTGDLAARRRSFGLAVAKASGPAAWAAVKDASNEGVMEQLYALITGCLADFKKYRDYEAGPEYEDRTLGEAQAPVKVQKANPYTGVIAVLNESILYNDTSLFDYLIGLSPDGGDYRLIELG